MQENVGDCIWAWSVNIYCFRYDVIRPPFWIFVKISQNQMKICFLGCPGPPEHKSVFFLFFCRGTNHYWCSHHFVFFKKLVKIQNEHIYSIALDLLSTNMVFIFACDEPLPDWPPFCFLTKIVKIDQIGHKKCLIGPIMTEYVLFVFAIVLYFD